MPRDTTMVSVSNLAKQQVNGSAKACGFMSGKHAVAENTLQRYRCKGNQDTQDSREHGQSVQSFSLIQVARLGNVRLILQKLLQVGFLGRAVYSMWPWLRQEHSRCSWLHVRQASLKSTRERIADVPQQCASGRPEACISQNSVAWHRCARSSIPNGVLGYPHALCSSLCWWEQERKSTRKALKLHKMVHNMPLTMSLGKPSAHCTRWMQWQMPTRGSNAPAGLCMQLDSR